MKANKAIQPAAKQGKKYGWSMKKEYLPKSRGHRCAGLDRTPPISGLPSIHEHKLSQRKVSDIRGCRAKTPHKRH